MRFFYPGQMALPLMLLLAGIALMMDRLDVIHVAGIWNLWPIALIAAGLEELYLWAKSGAASGKATKR
jgi:hypothetical protein